MAWTQTTYSFSVGTSTVPVSGADATLSGTAPFLRFTDTDSGHEDWRLSVDADNFKLQWLSSTGPDVWTDVLAFDDPAAATRTLTLTDYALFFTGLDAAQVFFRSIVSTEANPRFRINADGKEEWGPGGASAVDTALERTAAGVLSTATLRLTAAPSDVNDATRKTYVDTADALKLNLSGGTMTGFITLHADPTAAMHAATRQFVLANTGVSEAGDTMTGTLTFDFAVSGTIIQSKVAAEANPRWRVSSAGVQDWGPGGGTAPDTTLQRGAADRLDLLDQLRVTGVSGVGIDFTTDNTVDIGASSSTFRPRAVYVGTNIGIGTTPATSGHLRLPNTGSIAWRNAANSGDIVGITIDAGDDLVIRPGSGGSIKSHADGGSDLGETGARFNDLFLAGVLRAGTNPAAAGTVRIPNAANVSARNAANSADVSLIQANASDRVLLSPGAADIQWGVALIALGGGAAPTLGTIGGSGPATAAQNSWMRVIDSTGAAFWVPVWK